MTAAGLHLIGLCESSEAQPIRDLGASIGKIVEILRRDNLVYPRNRWTSKFIDSDRMASRKW